MWDDLFSAMALVLVFEGVLPFLTPTGYRRAMLSMMQLDDQRLRFAGLTSMLVGLLFLYVIKN